MNGIEAKTYLLSCKKHGVSETDLSNKHRKMTPKEIQKYNARRLKERAAAVCTCDK